MGNFCCSLPTAQFLKIGHMRIFFSLLSTEHAIEAHKAMYEGVCSYNALFPVLQETASDIEAHKAMYEGVYIVIMPCSLSCRRLLVI